MHNDELLSELVALETELHRWSSRSNRKRLNELLHDDFQEIGRSGSMYGRQKVLESLPEETNEYTIHADTFHACLLGEAVALLTYRSSRTDACGTRGSYALRSSLWQRGNEGWRMRFHQGTPCAPFS